MHLERIDHRGAGGWAWHPSQPGATLQIEAVHKGKVIATTLADELRSDLYLAGKGTGRYGFNFSFLGLKRGRKPPTIRIAEGLQNAAVTDDSTQPVGPPEGHIDYQNRQMARGWVWRPTNPDETITVEARCDGKVIGRALANEMRDDLLSGGKGTGRYGFTMGFYEPLRGEQGPEFYAVTTREDYIAGNLPLPRLSKAEKLYQAGLTLENLLIEHQHFTQPGAEFEHLDPGIISGIQNPAAANRPLILAFYLPQFHATPENDRNWGTGFTEWRQLARGMPRFPGHYQPRTPRDLGFYDLRDRSVLPRQTEMAKAGGIGAFCYYYYWFNGKRVLDAPLNEHLESSIDMPFTIMWTNENWTRTWDGSEDEVLLRQDYRDEHEDALLADLARHFADPRYVRLDGRPLFLLYNPRHIPQAPDTIRRWREKLRKGYDLDPLFFMAQTFETSDPTPFGFDGAIEFPPHKLARGPHRHETPAPYSTGFKGRIIAYDDFVETSLGEDEPDYPLIKTVVPSWDNEARRPGWGLSLSGASPSKYQSWLRSLIDRAIDNPIHGTPIVAVNAWNEWAEAAYLEPDVHCGSAFLNATARALVEAVNDSVPAERRKALPAVTVILPCYNHARFLKRRIMSVLNQTVPPKEIIFLDDASSDDSVAIAEALLKHCSIPCRMEVNATNSGSVIKQWLKGISLAENDFIWIAETDDAADPEFLANILPAFGRGDVLGAYGRIQCIDGQGKPRGDLDSYYDGLGLHSWDRSSVVSAHKSFSRDFSIQNVVPNVSGFVFRKPKLSDREVGRLIQYRFAGDWYFYSLVLRGGSLAYRRKAKSYFRVSRRSASRSAFATEQHLREHQMIVQDLSGEYGIGKSTLAAHATRLSVHFPDKTPESLLQMLEPMPVKRQLRICIAAHSFSVGGGELLPIHLANRLKGKGCHITYLVKEAVPHGRASIRHRLRSDIPVVYWRDVCDDFGKFIEDFGIDVLNSHNVGIDYHLFRLAVDLPCSLISSLHGGYETVPELLDTDFVTYLRNQVDGWLYLAERSRTLLFDAGLETACFLPSFNAVETSDIEWEDRREFESRYDLPSDVFSLVICSRAILSKGWETCIQVAGLLNARQARPIHLFLIGDGPDLEMLRDKYGGDPHVHFLGHVDSPIRLLQCFDLSIFPSTYAGESFPLFLLESMAAGLPIISSDAGDIHRLMGPAKSQAGVLVSSNQDPAKMAEAMANRVMEYLKDRDVHDRARANAKRNSRRFTLDKLAEHYISFFRKRMAARQTSPTSRGDNRELTDVS